MSRYAIMRFQKYKVGSVANIERHQNHRDRLRNRKYPEREGENYTWKRYDETMTQTVRKAIKAQEQETGRKVRKDVNVICELVLTFSPEMEHEVDLVEWMKANIRWVGRTFGKGKTLRVDLNRDETTTHIHCFVIMTDEQGRFNSSRFFNKKKQVIEMQDSYAEAMKQFGLERGQSKDITSARHKTLQEWRTEECERLEKELSHIADRIFADKPKIEYKGTIDTDVLNDER
ncbi:MAG: plasmid recombination protein [Clostridia bacterium]|nr:plasmid recombination protein [Clostridia bacterium]